MICVHKKISGDHMKKREMHMARNGGEGEKCTQIFWWGKQMDGGHIEHLDLYSKRTLKLMLKKKGGYGMDLSGSEQVQGEGCFGHVY